MHIKTRYVGRYSFFFFFPEKSGYCPDDMVIRSLLLNVNLKMHKRKIIIVNFDNSSYPFGCDAGSEQDSNLNGIQTFEKKKYPSGKRFLCKFPSRF